MHLRHILAALLLHLPITATSQQEGAEPTGTEQLPEEVAIIGDRSLTNLLRQMQDAEKAAYDIFNRLNDDKRFHISCSTQEPTGSRFKSQLCQPRFEIEAWSAHGRAYLENYRALLDDLDPGYQPMVTHQPAEALIASQQEEYRAKMRRVAEENPAFLNALVRYSELKERYDRARGLEQ